MPRINHTTRPTTLKSPVTSMLLLTATLLVGCQSTAPLKSGVDAHTGKASISTQHGNTEDDVTGFSIANAQGGNTSCCVRDDLWERIRKGFKLDLTLNNARIDAERNWYLRNPKYMDRVIARGYRYLHFIVEEAEARDMPLELTLLPIVESAFDPFAYSVADAAGPWQFIPSTGRIYGLKQTWWYDGRRDITLSTRAALDYLERLAARFDGDYYKALASYNAGSGTVSRAISRNMRAGKQTDYWSLHVPRETSAYVPKLLALAQIVQNPDKYGVRLNPIPNEPRFISIDVGQQIDLARAAELANMPLTELYLYNPAWSRWVTDPQSRPQLLVPVELAEAFKAALTATAKNEYIFTIRHDVVAGETLESIARQHNVSSEAIGMINHLPDQLVNAGETLVIPQPRLPFASGATTYAPRIARLNQSRDLKGNVTRQTKYTVRAGDTLSGIARKQKVSVRDIARWNSISVSKTLHIGQTLRLENTTSQSPKAASVAKTNKRDKRTLHRVKPGETLTGLARKFNVSIHDVARWNDFSPKKELRIGEKIHIYLD